MSSGIFVSPEGEVLSKIKEAISLAGSQARLSDWLGCSPDLVSLWKLKKRWIRFDFLKSISHFTGANIMNLIDGCKLRGQNVGASHDNGFIVFRKEMSSQKARVIGWVLTDGHIHSEGNMITVIQKHKSVLKKLIPDFQNEFGMGRSHFGIYSMNNCWRLRIGSAPLKFVFAEFYEIPAGCKYSKIRIPPSLFNADYSTKMSFLTAIMEGDGSFTFARSHGKIYPMISFQLKNETFVHSLRVMLKNMSSHPAKCGSRIRGDFGVILKRGKEVSRFIQDGLPYMSHESKKRRALELLEILNDSGQN